MSFAAIGQSNATYYDYQTFHFGFTIGVNSSDIRASYGKLPLLAPNGRMLVGISSASTLGPNIGLIADLKLAKYFDLRFIPAISLTQRNVSFTFQDSLNPQKFTQQDRKLEASYLELPLYLKYKSDEYRNYRFYVITGPKLGLNLTNTSKVTTDPTLLKLTGSDLSWTIGVGMDLYGDEVKLSPELSYSFGLRNVYIPANQDIVGAIKTIFTQSLVLSLHFE